MKTLSIYFDARHIPENPGLYCLYPDSAMKDMRGNVAITDDRGLAWIDKVKASLHSELSGRLTTAPALYHSINNLFYWFYWPLFRNIMALRKIVADERIEQVIVHGESLPHYSALQCNGGEGAPKILYFPEYLCADLLRQGLSDVVEVKSERPRKLGGAYSLLAWARPYVLFGIKFFFCVLMWARFRALERQAPKGQAYDVVVLARSSAVSNMKSLFKKLASEGKKVALFYDPTLYQIKNPLRAASFAPKEIATCFAPQYSSLLEVLASSKAAFSRLGKQLVTLTNGTVSLTHDLGPILKELELADCDIALHSQRLATFLKTNKAATVMTAELCTPYIFRESEVARELAVPFYTYQSMSFSPDEVVDCVVGNGFITQSEKFRAALEKVIPSAKPRLHYLGDVNFSYRTKPPSTAGPLRILYFSQPYETETQDVILRTLEKAVTKPAFDAELFVKVHPRDDVKAFKGRPHVQVVEGTESIADLISSADLVVSRTSSTLNDALVCGTPYLSCVFSDSDRKWRLPFLDPALGVLVFSPEELANRLVAAREYIREFSERRDRFAATYSKPFDVRAFLRLGNQTFQPL